ncbi:PLP-dependent transferase [Acephala macrosclerotiorum]|nr:PLP-dependent transferase [Acephala macrosclerotiorum]
MERINFSNPPDAVFEATKGFLADSDPRKVNVGVGTYRDEIGKHCVLPSIRMAEELVANCSHEYLPIAGLETFRDKAAELACHDTKVWSEGRLKKANPSLKTTLIVEPTWSNHDLLLRYLGFDVIKLPYYKAGNFDFASYTAASRAAPWGSVVVLHSCAHNPTRCDPSMEQWKEIVAVIAQKCMFPIFDPAYLGFNSGNVYEDACAIRYFIEGLKMGASVYLSFAKSMRIYGERMGLVIFATNSQDTTRVINSILENVQRATVCSPPVYGAQIAGAVLNNPAIVKQWGQDLITMGHQNSLEVWETIVLSLHGISP